MKVIANIGVNWWDGDRSEKRAYELVDTAIDIGVSGICIPFFDPRVFRDEEQIKQVTKFKLAPEILYDLVQKALAKNITVYASPRNPDDIPYLEKIDVSGYHVQNGDILYAPLLEAIEPLRKPVLLSTGFATFEEIDNAVEILLGEQQPDEAELVLLHSTGGLPTIREDAELRRILDLAQEFFPLYVGFESFLSEQLLDFVSMAFNPAVIMRRLDLEDRKGVETEYSLTPTQMKNLVAIVDAMELVNNPVLDQNGFTQTAFDARQSQLRCEKSDFLLPPRQ